MTKLILWTIVVIHMPFNYDLASHSVQTSLLFVRESVLNFGLNVDPSFATLICSTLFLFSGPFFPLLHRLLIYSIPFRSIYALCSIPINSVLCRRFWIFIEFPALYILYILTLSWITTEEKYRQSSIRHKKCLFMRAIIYDNGSYLIDTVEKRRKKISAIIIINVKRWLVNEIVHCKQTLS